MKDALVKTILYSMLFEYPLTKEELWQYLIISTRMVTRKEFEKTLKKLPPGFSSDKTYYFLAGRSDLVSIRKKRETISREKFQKARSLLHALSHIPTVQLIAVSGALAMHNAKEDDDIDIFIITKEQTLWITRLLSLFILAIFGRRRTRGKTHAKDAVCLNMLLDETALSLPQQRHDLYTAHEVMQVKVVFDRNASYQMLLRANQWIRRFLPKRYHQLLQGTRKRNHHGWFTDSLVQFLSLFEPCAKAVQYRYMQSHVTSETITDTMLAFHPYDYRSKTLRAFEQVLRHYVPV